MKNCFFITNYKTQAIDFVYRSFKKSMMALGFCVKKLHPNDLVLAKYTKKENVNCLYFFVMQPEVFRELQVAHGICSDTNINILWCIETIGLSKNYFNDLEKIQEKLNYTLPGDQGFFKSCRRCKNKWQSLIGISDLKAKHYIRFLSLNDILSNTDRLGLNHVWLHELSQVSLFEDGYTEYFPFGMNKFSNPILKSKKNCLFFGHNNVNRDNLFNEIYQKSNNKIKKNNNNNTNVVGIDFVSDGLLKTIKETEEYISQYYFGINILSNVQGEFDFFDSIRTMIFGANNIAITTNMDMSGFGLIKNEHYLYFQNVQEFIDIFYKVQENPYFCTVISENMAKWLDCNYNFTRMLEEKLKKINIL